jgi:hypothetical protein
VIYDGRRGLWRTLTRTEEATTAALCRLARRILAEEAKPGKREERVLEVTKLLRDSEWGEMACGACDPRPGSLRAPPSGNRPVLRAFGWERAIVPCQR